MVAGAPMPCPKTPSRRRFPKPEPFTRASSTSTSRPASARSGTRTFPPTPRRRMRTGRRISREESLEIERTLIAGLSYRFGPFEISLLVIGSLESWSRKSIAPQWASSVTLIQYHVPLEASNWAAVDFSRNLREQNSNLCYKLIRHRMVIGQKRKAVMSDKDRYVVKHGEEWAVKKAHAKRASEVTRTQAEAEVRAKEIVSNLGGGEVRIQGRDAKFRDSDTVPPGNDPNPPKDKKH